MIGFCADAVKTLSREAENRNLLIHII